jgi:beta-N-acetylhexosaminidase
LVTGLLRQELGFDGVVVTDGLGMSAARMAHGDTEAPLRALQAGVDQLLTPAGDSFPGAIKTIQQAVDDGEISVERIDESVERIMRLKRKAGLMDKPLVSVERAAHIIGTREHQEMARRLIGTVT